MERMGNSESSHESSASFLYLKPGETVLHKCSTDQPPPIPKNCVRVVCISDTHNEHESIGPLPWGHLLIHAGDVTTESGLRHIYERKKDDPSAVTPQGRQLVERFAVWFGAQPHPHKILIGGNHDWVFQALGKVEVRKILDSHSVPGTIAYLDHEEATLGSLKVFGSPYAHWGGHNDAFMCNDDSIYSKISENTSIVVTHKPAILPRSQGGQRESTHLVQALINTGTLLHVSGHCHWAHGLYFPKQGNVSCVVASLCDSKWLSYLSLVPGPSGKRGDPKWDLLRGGYNLFFPIIVCDLLVPGGPPSDAVWVVAGCASSLKTNTTSANTNSHNQDHKQGHNDDNHDHKPNKPTLLFFGPPTDTAAVTRLVPLLSQHFTVQHFDDATEAINSIQGSKHPYTACVAKLGSKGNLGIDVAIALRNQSATTFTVIHSATAMKSESSQQSLGPYVNLIVDHRSEAEMLTQLENVAKKTELNSSQ